MRNVINWALRTHILLAWIVGASSAMAGDLYVSPIGNDRNPGTKEKPFATLTHARDRVAKVNAKMTGDVTVYLRGGTYELSASVVFGPADSGHHGHKIIYKAFPGETPIVSGGKAIKGWSLHDKEKNIYKAAVGDLEFRQIYVNGVRAVRARHPNKTSEVTLGDYLVGANMTGKAPYQLKVNPAELSQWDNLNEVEVVMVTHWKQKRARIESFKDGLISFQAPENTARAMYHMEQPGTPHFYENAYEFLDAEGEFYLNTKQDILYYKPRQGENLSSVEVIAPSVQTLLDIKGSSPSEMVRDISFEGITFQYSKWTEPNQKGFTVMQSATTYSGVAAHFDNNAPVPGAVQLQNASRVEIRLCRVRKTSAHGIIAIKDVVSDCSIIGNHVSDTGAGGIYLLLNDAKSTGNAINDNTVEDIGMVYSDGCGILVTCTPDVTIQHNEIRNVRYTGISTGWSWNDKDTAARNHDVGFNLIHRVMGLHDDGGGIYTLGKIPGMKIHHNYIHDIVRSKYSGSYGICGIYLDNGSCFKHVHDNVVANVEAAFFSGNKPNYKNVFESNYHNCRLATVIENGNTVTNNTPVQGANWPGEAKEIMEKAGPRGDYRRPKLVSTIIPAMPGKIGGALFCDGGTAFVEAAHSPELEPEQLTLQAWIRMDEFPAGRDTRRWIVNKNGNEFTEGHYALVLNGDRAGAYLNIGGGKDNLHDIWSPAGSLKLKQWHQLAMTYDGSTMKVFLDGKEVAAKEIKLERSKGILGLAVGRRQDAYKSTYIKGRIDDVRIYDRVLSAGELTALYDKPAEVEDAKSENGLVGYWPF